MRKRRLILVALTALAWIALIHPANAAEAAGAGIEVDGKHVGGFVITRTAETRQELVKQLDRRRITFERDYTIPVDADDPNIALLKGKISITSRIRGNRIVEATTNTLKLVKRGSDWFVDKASLDQALKAQPSK